MPKESPIMTSFNGGEFSPLLYGRIDFDKYKSGAKTLLNFIPTIQGPLIRRPGTMFVAEVKDHTKKPRLIEFEFSTEQAYIIEAGEGYFRFYKDNGQIIEAPKTITGVTQANPAVVTSNAHGYSNGDHIYIDSFTSMTELTGGPYTVANVTTNTYELQGIDSTGFSAYTTGAVSYRIYDISNSYLESELFEIKYTQSADVLYLVHPSHQPQTLSRTGHTSWTLSDFEFRDGPYLALNATTTTLTSSSATGSVTVTASSTTGINGGSGFLSTDVGRVMRMATPGAGSSLTWAWGEITAWTSTTVVTVLVKDNSFNTSGTVLWRLGLYSDTTGWPAAVTFFEDRLCFGGATDNPQRVDGSENGDYTSFSPTEEDGTVIASNAIAFVLNANNVNAIRWMQDDERGLFIGTTGGEWILRGTGGSALAANAAPQANRSTNYGSANVQPIRIGKVTLFLQKARRKIRQLRYVFQDDGFSASDSTLLSENITSGGVYDMAYHQSPSSIAWCVRNDGTLLGLTYEAEQDVIAWHRHELGGTDTVVEAVADIPAPAEDRSETWVAVSRTINGGTKRYIEYLTEQFDSTKAKEDAFFVDSGLLYDGAATDSITGLSHLEGEIVSVLTDGAAHPDVTVQNGAIALQLEAEKVAVGLGYNSDYESLSIEAGAEDGTAQGKLKRIHRVIFNLYRSLGIKVGPSSSNLETQVFRTTSTPYGESPELFTGYIEVDWDGDYEDESNIFIRQDQPLPLTVIAIMPHIITQDR